MFFAGGAREVYSAVYTKPVLRDPGDARALEAERLRPQDIDMMAFHPQGTCRMGGDPRSAVTDSFGEYHGVRHLYVGDASLFPSSCKVNPQITIMALAARIAAHIASGL
jgi:choline dehydrogenase-like flavoprotein